MMDCCKTSCTTSRYYEELRTRPNHTTYSRVLACCSLNARCFLNARCSSDLGALAFARSAFPQLFFLKV